MSKTIACSRSGREPGRRPDPGPAAAGARLLLIGLALVAACSPAFAAGGAADSMPWWAWPALLFMVCFVLGIVAVPAGIGGGVLYVPIVGGLFPFHLDFVRGAGLMVALGSALAASPGLLRIGFASLRLALPLSLLVGVSQIAGAVAGLTLPAAIVQTLLGLFILGIVVLMSTTRASELPPVAGSDAIAAALRIHGVFHDVARGKPIDWTVHRTPSALLAFAVIGLLAGLFGLGAGFANVPALNLIMGAPLKVAAGTSSLILASSSSAAWVYINQGAMMPIVVVPSIIGTMLGAMIGVRVLRTVRASAVRRLVIAMLLLAGGRALARGLGIF
jgi:uncharacterized protein